MEVRRLHSRPHMAARRSSAAEIEGWSHSALDPLEKSDEYEVTRTEAGSSSVARALFAIRSRLRDDWEDSESPYHDTADDMPVTPHTAETMPAPAPAKSDIRMLGGSEDPSSADAFTVYVDALREPAVEVEARTIPPPRQRRETVLMPMRPRQPTLPMIDRPLQTPATPPSAIVPMSQRAPAVQKHSTPDSVPPRPFRGSGAMLLLAFGIGMALAALVVVVLGAL
jgi:hypothetical protein